MSHHLDSPIARQDVRLDITDLYVFRGELGTVLLINVCHSLGGATVEGFHPEGMYEFKIDLDGDAVEDLTYRVTFGERDGAGRQDYEVMRLSGAAAADPFAEGSALLSGRTGTTAEAPGGARAWAGRAADPFWIEPDVLHAVGHAVADGTTLDLGDWEPARARNLFDGETVYSLVLELPDGDVVAHGSDARIGVWAVASLRTDAGGWRSINRVGLPMIHPLFTQFDEKLGDDLNAGVPADDHATYSELVASRISGVVGAHQTAQDPQAYGHSVAQRLFPNILPYTVGTPAVFGFAGWNGRSLTDNAPDVMFSLALNTPIALGIGPDSVTAKPSQQFPYIPTPGDDS
ncbi:DUF4331 family protein [Mycolicibacterium sp. S2-37]|uniref:DUF4331 family protein n=1 Tax=Mycolicibacterium sp. S2-37 TaxID=2810297 RepID=UPI001A943B0F|nr:DUF4331 family protein [Mycolicibacterium sp. S2-37]MBO0680673.1 DUF4331 family protein [Mycolicibacterium sp. S2-37]